jgi:glutamate 5-kinase
MLSNTAMDSSTTKATERSRAAYLQAVKRIVVKLGTQLLSDTQGRLDAGFVASIAAQVAELRRSGVLVTIVSSGAVGAGLRELKLTRRPADIAKLQAVAAVGQRRLMDVWADAFEPFGLPVAQLLITREDIDDRTRFLNVRNTILAAHDLGAVPIINENDTISTDELVKITFGDNDILAALVANAMRANLLVLLTVVDGVLDAQGKAVRLVKSADEARELVRSETSSLGKGGMSSKVEAARMVTGVGEVMIIANGRDPDVLPRILRGEEVGTLFTPAHKPRTSRSRWIGSVRPAGSIVVDSGAEKALLEKNRSLLPAGVVKVIGPFERGDIVSIVSSEGREIARGLSNYGHAQVDLIRGRKTGEVRTMLGEFVYDEIVHRDNLAVL